MTIATAPAETKAVRNPNINLMRYQVRAFDAIRKNEGQPYGASALASDLNVGSETANDLLTHLTAHKYIERKSGQFAADVCSSAYRVLVELDPAQDALLAHGTNVTRKRADILRALSSSPDKVATCMDIAKATSLDLPYTHALLKALAGHGVVELVPDSKPIAYRLLADV